VLADAGLADLSFFGRSDELLALAGAFERAAAGHGRLVAVCEEAGIGKSRLVEELVRRAGLPPGRVPTGRCFEQTGAPSYWPWIRVLRASAATHGLEGLRAELGGGLAEVGAFLPELFPDGAPPVPPPGAELEARFRLFEAIAGLIRAAFATPGVIVLEDVHWADEASLDLLEMVARSLWRRACEGGRLREFPASSQGRCTCTRSASTSPSGCTTPETTTSHPG
jgi:predicted ATPase